MQFHGVLCNFYLLFQSHQKTNELFNKKVDI